MIQASTDNVTLVIAVVGGLSAILSASFGAGGAWMASKKSLNGARSEIRRTDENVAEMRTELKSEMGEIKKDLRTLVTSDGNQNERLARLDEKVDAHAGWIRRVEQTATAATERRKEPRE